MSKGKYLGRSKWVKIDENGELTGEIKEVDEFETKVNRSGFMITYMSAIINLIDKLGTKKMQVMKYIFENMSKTENTLIITTDELAKKSKVSKPVVIETLKILEDSNLIKRRTGAIILHPRLIHKGDEFKERYLLTKFETFEE